MLQHYELYTNVVTMVGKDKCCNAKSKVNDTEFLRCSVHIYSTWPHDLYKENSLFYNYRNVFLLMRLAFCKLLSTYLTPTLLNSLQNLDQSSLVRYKSCTLVLPPMYKIYLFSKMFSSSPEELTNSLIQTA